MYKKKIFIVIFFHCCLLFSMSAQELQTPEMKPIDYQIGKWLATEVKTDKEGRRLQFSYELEWFDHKQSIAKMTISGMYEDGEIQVYWEGFKNWNSQEEKILYTGFSRDGRVAKGYMNVESDNVVKSIYSGFDPAGNKVFIEDIATQIDNRHYTSRTQLRMDGQDEWKVVNTDHWVKVDRLVYSDDLK